MVFVRRTAPLLTLAKRSRAPPVAPKIVARLMHPNSRPETSGTASPAVLPQKNVLGETCRNYRSHWSTSCKRNMRFDSQPRWGALLDAIHELVATIDPDT